MPEQDKPMRIPWELRRRGLQDSRRHDRRVREAIKQNLPHLVAEEAIITSDGKRKVRVPIRYLEQHRFKYGHPQEGGRGVGQGAGQSGDVIAKTPEEVQNGGSQAGDLPGDEIYDAELNVDELAQMMLEQLGLPWLEAKRSRRLDAEDFPFREVRRKGLWSNLDKRRTLLENLKRHAAKNDPRVGPFADEDLRFRTWVEEQREASQAAVYCLMDRSGSMSTEKKYIAKTFFFWLARFLRQRYNDVEMVFIAHDVEAQVVQEENFFRISNSGGTRCSSAFRLALEHLREHHPASRWNNYVFHFSDGDNLTHDNYRVRDLVKELLTESQMVGYGEIAYDDWPSFLGEQNPQVYRYSRPRPASDMLETLRGLQEQRLITAMITKREDVYKALEAFLKVEERDAS